MPALTNKRYVRPTRLGSLDALQINHPHFQAVIALQGAHLVRFAPAGEPDWLWLSPTARFEAGRAIRGGIPVCWPWFGDPLRNPEPVRALLDSGQPPAHGVARTIIWAPHTIREADDEVTVVLALEPAALPPGLWRGKARALLAFRLRRESLSLELTTVNTGEDPLALTQALHTYLPVADITRTSIGGLEGATYLDTLDEWHRKTQTDALVFSGETDRIYQAAPAITIRETGGVKRLSARGSDSTVVWNPGPEKAVRLSDFPDHAWTSMLCVETANAADDYRELVPGESHTLAMTLSRHAAPEKGGEGG